MTPGHRRTKTRTKTKTKTKTRPERIPFYRVYNTGCWVMITDKHCGVWEWTDRP
jgi:hypothetical protein